MTLRWTDNASNESGFYVERAAKAKNLQFSRIATRRRQRRRRGPRSESSGQWVYRVQAYNADGRVGVLQQRDGARSLTRTRSLSCGDVVMLVI